MSAYFSDSEANFLRVLLIGGLGDVAGALPKALARRGHRVMVRFSL